ncbi:EamA family transporter [Mucilaginibacter limnophilus]|uniref:EamA family transporter n=1 Tax=Mucilaginibacter limnophilus TaxID=1932778 RepID=A0A437MYH8_9SPHI|nr:EamA family transporter [Mucilaginibacter limnophilus]RVU02732.1 EamA family transporter [Mucilaginibacter limnophilus]
MSASTKHPSTLLVVIAFALVYVVWGSTYFFIQMGIKHMPPLVLGATRFILSGGIMLAWCLFTGEKVWNLKFNIHSAISGLLMLFGGNGALIWAERTVPSALAAILVSAAPVWFVLLDKSHWRANFTNVFTILGLIIGFGGVVLLFSDQLDNALGEHSTAHLSDLVVIIVGSMLWAAGSLYSKYKATGNSTTVNTAWQMLAAGVAFIPFSLMHGDFKGFSFDALPAQTWYAVGYLVIFGSIIAFSAYVWLLEVRPAAQVSTYAYVNPVIAVILGVAFANESITWLQIGGLVIILISVLLINLDKYRKPKQAELAVE